MLQECFTRVLKAHITVCIALTLQQYLLGWCYRSVLPECWKDTSTCAPRSSLALLKVTFLPTRLAGLRLTDLNSEYIFLWEHRVILQCCAHPLEQAAIPHLASLFLQSSSCPTTSIPFPTVLFLPYCQHPFSHSPRLALLPASLFPQSSSCPTASIPFPTVLFSSYSPHPFSYSPLLLLLPSSLFPQYSLPTPVIPFPTVLSSSYSPRAFSHSTLLALLVIKCTVQADIDRSPWLVCHLFLIWHQCACDTLEHCQCLLTLSLLGLPRCHSENNLPKVPNLKQLRPFFSFTQPCEGISIKMHSIESRFVIGPSFSFLLLCECLWTYSQYYLS